MTLVDGVDKGHTHWAVDSETDVEAEEEEGEKTQQEPEEEDDEDDALETVLEGVEVMA